MMRELGFLYTNDRPLVLTVGDGVTVGQTVEALLHPQLGSLDCSELASVRIPEGEGPTRFVWTIRSRVHGMRKCPRVRDVWEGLTEVCDELTYEAGLRWMLAATVGALFDANALVVLPPKPIVDDGKPVALVFGLNGGFDSACLRSFNPEAPWPEKHDVLMAYSLDHLASMRR